MPRIKTVYVCQSCGYVAPKWAGRCPDCKSWNTMMEEQRESSSKSSAKQRTSASLSRDQKPVRLVDVRADGEGEVRMRTGLAELDTVLGGGLVAGSLVLVGGDPGVGKSTLLLTAAERLAQRGAPILYVSGEESVQQVHLRAQRLGLGAPHLHLLSHTDFGHVESAIRSLKPTVVVLDSVQTVYLPQLPNIPGSVTQVREVAHRAMLLAKSTNTAVFLVGHVTKSGELAGPKVLEHFVDTVIHFEGDGRTPLRILRSVKNRFGPAGELGVFEMVDSGLQEVPDASARLLSERVLDAAGTAVVASLEGTRPLLTEVQALVGRAAPGNPARTCVGVDRQRVAMIAAILGKAGLHLHDRDLFVNAAGGVRLEETAADTAILAAIASSLRDQPLDPHTLVFGELGLVGEVRGVGHAQIRLKEAARHGFRRAIVPYTVDEAPPGLELVRVRSVRDLLAAL
ncbi:MAG: DNA repair protein RadA [Myxococcota bacterium]